MTDKSNTYDNETFVYGDKEVFKTGRIAQKTKKLRGGRSKTIILYEICPVSMKEKQTMMYNQWVELEDLLVIRGTINTEEEQE